MTSSKELVIPIALLGGLALGFLLVRRAARRFEARQRARGLWDEHGPKVEAAPEPGNQRLFPGIASQASAGLGGGTPRGPGS